MGTIEIDGATPKLTIGNATAEDATILFDGAAQDFHIGLDDTADDLVIGVGSALGTTTALAIDENAGSTFSGTVTVGVDDTGKDVKFFGATSGKYWLWDESADGVVQIGTHTVGVDDAGHDVKFFGATASSYMLWDESADDLNLIASGLGVTTAKDLGAGIHIRTADSGASVAAGADELVIENSGAAGISILSGTSSNGSIYFADSGGTSRGWVEYEHANGKLTMGTENATALTIDTNGIINKPLQPYFHVIPTSSQDDIANGTTIAWGTETKDVGSNFASNTFTAPITGVYAMSALVNTSDYDSSADYVWLNLVTSNRTHKLFIQGTGLDADSYFFLGGTAIVDMDVNDTATVTWEQSGGASQANILATNAHWYGYLLG